MAKLYYGIVAPDPAHDDELYRWVFSTRSMTKLRAFNDATDSVVYSWWIDPTRPAHAEVRNAASAYGLPAWAADLGPERSTLVFGMTVAHTFLWTMTHRIQELIETYHDESVRQTLLWDAVQASARTRTGRALWFSRGLIQFFKMNDVKRLSETAGPVMTQVQEIMRANPRAQAAHLAIPPIFKLLDIQFQIPDELIEAPASELRIED